MIAALPQTGQRHRNDNGVAAAGSQSQFVSGCFIGGTPVNRSRWIVSYSSLAIGIQRSPIRQWLEWGPLLTGASGDLHSLRWFISRRRIILERSHWPHAKWSERRCPQGGLTGASARCKIPILLGLAWAFLWPATGHPPTFPCG
jgi:hypothetical protein